MGNAKAPICAAFLIFLFIFHTGHSLECYTCNTTLLDDYPCKGAPVEKCTDPAVCLSVTVLEQDTTLNTELHVTYKTCYPNMAGQECDIFLKMLKDTSPMTAKLQDYGNCYTCKEDGCNQYRYRSSATAFTIPTVLVGLLSIIFAAKVL